MTATDANNVEVVAYSEYTGAVNKEPDPVDPGVTKIIAGTGIEIDPTAGTGDVTINSTVTGLEFAGNVDVTDETTIPTVRSANQLYVNIGQGTFHPDWAAITNNAEDTDTANPGDFMLLDTNTTDTDPWTWIEGGTPPSSDGTWIDDGAGNLYPATITNNVGIGTENPSTKLHVKDTGLTRVTLTSEADDKNVDIACYNLDGLQAVFGYNTTQDSLDIDTRTTSGVTTFSRSGSVRAVIDGAGNVGIGTTSPQARLHVQGPAANSLIAKFGANNGAPERALELNEFLSLGANSAGFQFNAPGVSGTGGSAAISLATAGTDRLYVDYLGNVGIGTDAPEGPLEVKTGAAGTRTIVIDKSDLVDGGGQTDLFNRIRSKNGGGLGYLEIRSYATHFSTNGNDQLMVLSNTGNVGIGTTNPAHKLDVNGDLNATNYRIDLLQELV